MPQDAIVILCGISTIVFNVCVANIVVRIPMLLSAIIDWKREKANKAKKGGP